MEKFKRLPCPTHPSTPEYGYGNSLWRSWLPPDKTRKPEWYDGIYSYLKGLAIKEI